MKLVPRSDTALFVGTVLWGEDLCPVSHGRLLIHQGKIARLLAESEENPPGVEVLDFGDFVILPGLIDTHCHLTLPGDGRNPDMFLQTSSDEILVAVGISNAIQALRGGVTTLRDLGSKNDTGFDIVQRLSDRLSPTPRVITSGSVLTKPRGHGWTFGIQIPSMIAAIRSIRDLHAKGASVIKVMASGGSTPGTQAWSPTFTTEELRAITSESHRLGIPVAAHVSCPAAAKRCLDADVDDLEHLNFWVNATYDNHMVLPLLERIEQSGVFVGPTLQTPYRILQGAKPSVDPRGAIRSKLYADVLSNFEAFARSEMRLIAGSDAGFLVTRFDELHLGLRLMIEHGLSAERAIRAGTIEAATALGLQDQIGCISPGLDADLLIVRGDPLCDIESLKAVESVFVRGKLVETDESTMIDYGITANS